MLRYVLVLAFVVASGRGSSVNHVRMRSKGSSSVLASTSTYSTPPHTSADMVNVESWPQYLIEWRGIEPSFRMDELADALSLVLPSVQHVVLNITRVIDDSLSDLPVLGYCHLPPGDDVIREIVRRCCTIRSVTEVWVDSFADGRANGGVAAASVDAVDESFFDRVVLPAFVGKGENSWRVDFRRYGRGGRSGLSYLEKSELLKGFDPIFRRLAQHPSVTEFNVNLTQSEHTFLYFEDWSAFHGAFEEKKKKKGFCIKAGQDRRPQHILFGRVVAEGINFEHAYAVRQRPFIGTTTMDAVSAQMSANAARLMRRGEVDARVLDPFAGTCSLLIAAANLGAMCVGSDIDADTLGLGVALSRTNADAEGERALLSRSKKNANFKRKRGDGTLFVQVGGSPVDNFEYYMLGSKLEKLTCCNVGQWLDAEMRSQSGSGVEEHENSFDAIVTDPPFGRRERAHDPSLGLNTGKAARGDPMGKCGDTHITLLQVAARVLKPGARLVFWMPTDADVDVKGLRKGILGPMQHISGVDSTLSFVRARRQPLHSNLARWLCVYRKIGGPPETIVEYVVSDDDQ